MRTETGTRTYQVDVHKHGALMVSEFDVEMAMEHLGFGPDDIDTIVDFYEEDGHDYDSFVIHTPKNVDPGQRRKSIEQDCPGSIVDVFEF